MLTFFVGSAAVVLLAGIALLIRKHRTHLPRWASARRDWALLIAILLMLLAGVEMAYVGPGSWIINALTWVRDHLGGIGPTVFALVALALLIKVAVAVLKQPDEKALWLAFALPLVFAMFSAGIFHDINNFLAPLAQQATAMISTQLGV